MQWFLRHLRESFLKFKFKQFQVHLKLQQEATEEVEHEIEQPQLFLLSWVQKVVFSLIVELELLFNQVVAVVDENKASTLSSSLHRQDGRVGKTTCQPHPTFEV